MPTITYRAYFTSGDHLQRASLPHPNKSTKLNAVKAFMILLDHGQHLLELVLDGCHVPLPLIVKHIQQPLGELHNVLANTIQDLSTPMGYHYFWASIHSYL